MNIVVHKQLLIIGKGLAALFIMIGPPRDTQNVTFCRKQKQTKKHRVSGVTSFSNCLDIERHEVYFHSSTLLHALTKERG